MMLQAYNKIIHTKPIEKCPEDKSPLIHGVLTCITRFCPKDVTELLSSWSC